MNYWIVDDDKELVRYSRLEIGGKGLGLVRLKRQSLTVPSFGIIVREGVKHRLWYANHELRSSIMEWCKRTLNKSSSKKLVVRSSAYEEDQRYSSFAGKFLTEVITNIDELIPTLDKVAEHYDMVIEGERAKISARPHGLAIILQEYISGDISGVCFSAEPMNANPHKAYCEIVVGNNKLLVDGETQPTRICFCPSTAELLEIQKGADGPEHLSDSLLTALSDGLMKMEWDYRTALDMEWTWDGKRIGFLQVRPITAIKPSQDLYPKECATCWFFDQRFVEPITPITRTTLVPLILQKAINEGLDMRGQSVTVEPYYFGGQVYLPHRVYFNLLEGCPKWWLSSDLKLLFSNNCSCPPRKMRLFGIHFWMDAFRSLLKHGRDAIFVLYRWKQWKKQLMEKLHQRDKIELTALTVGEWVNQWEQWQKQSEEFLEIHRWAILWSSYVYRLGGKYIVRGKEKQYPSITTRANHLLITYLHTHDSKIRNLLFTEYSHRTESLDFMSPRWGEWLSGEEHNEVFETRLIEDKKNIPTKAFPAEERGNILYRMFSQFVHLREEQRFVWEKILYEQKKLLKEAGRRLVEKGILNDPGEIWFMTWQELSESLKEGKQVNLTNILARRHQWCVEQAFTKPSFINFETNPLIDIQGDTWLGWGVSGGRVKGTAYVTNNPTLLQTDIQRPRILVTPCLNPGQTWSLQYWDGVLLERGSELSHPAIVAREMDIPMITNLPEITRKVHTGDILYIDATYGKVTRSQKPYEEI